MPWTYSQLVPLQNQNQKPHRQTLQHSNRCQSRRELRSGCCTVSAQAEWDGTGIGLRGRERGYRQGVLLGKLTMNGHSMLGSNHHDVIRHYAFHIISDS